MKAIKMILSGYKQSYSRSTLNGTILITERTPTYSALTGLLMACAGFEQGEKSVEEWNANTKGVRYWLHIPEEVYGRVMVEYRSFAKGEYPTACGKLTQSPQTMLIQFLVDARFVVYITGPDDVLEEMSQVMRAPIFAPYLGRRECIPRENIFGGMVEINVDETFEEIVDPLAPIEPNPPPPVYYQIKKH